MYLFLIRHGETDWNSEGRMQGRIDLPLNPRGIDQAQRLADRLATEERIDFIYTSPLSRARATAEIVAKPCGLNPIPDVRLVERSIGRLEGMTLADFKLAYPELYRLWHESKDHFRLPEGETRQECLDRIQSFLEMLRRRHDGASIALVTHGGTLSLMLASSIGLDLTKRFPFHFDNASLSKLDLSSILPRIDLLNDTCHLNHTDKPSRTRQREDGREEPQAFPSETR